MKEAAISVVASALEAGKDWRNTLSLLHGCNLLHLQLLPHVFGQHWRRFLRGHSHSRSRGTQDWELRSGTHLCSKTRISKEALKKMIKRRGGFYIAKDVNDIVFDLQRVFSQPSVLGGGSGSVRRGGVASTCRSRHA